MLVDGLADTCSASTMSSDNSNSSSNGNSTAALPVVSSGAVLSSSGPPPQPPQHGAADGYPDAPDTKEGIEELCPVCGDKVSGYHYGLLTCESCKGFFKRTVQNKKVYTCVADRSCHIDKSQRKRCPFCRFQKCLDVGMKLEAVRADRMRGGRNKFGPMYKRDRARKLQMLRQKQLALSQCSSAGGSEASGAGGPLSVGSAAGVHYALPPSASVSSPGLYSPEPGGPIKQEIQIPQLSSSTSSPDSSPSPLAGLVGQPMALVPQQHPTQQQQQQQQQHQGQQQQQPQGPPPGGPPSAAAQQGHYATAPTAAQPDKTAPPQAPPTPAWLTQGPSSPPKPFPAPYEPGPLVAPDEAKVPALVREFQKNMLDDKEWQTQLFGLLQNQTYNQCEVDLFELMCKVIDQSLFAQVDWARSTIFFKDLRVDDQMKLLQQSWSDMLILDHVHQRLHNGLPDDTTLPNGQKFSLVSLALLGLPALADQLHALAARLQELRFDPVDYVCLKFLLLLNPDVRTLSNVRLVHEAQEQTKQVHLEYCLNNYPQITDKFGQLYQMLPSLKLISTRGEEYLFYKHMSGSAPSQTLLMEMLHAKKK
ncbi:ftz transcription factor 1 [Dermacentor variabilis]|uniref:ftz transcription factor 1 n=1 Tax=Dermacentor variabilis TaxID=34621 RepID=UPI003F5C3F03